VIEPRSGYVRGPALGRPTRKLAPVVPSRAPAPRPAPPSPPRQRVKLRRFLRDADGVVTAAIEYERLVPVDELLMLEAAEFVMEQITQPFLVAMGQFQDSQAASIREIAARHDRAVTALMAANNERSRLLREAVLNVHQAIAKMEGENVPGQ
jgi:Flp pilus assembly pilin Flp